VDFVGRNALALEDMERKAHVVVGLVVLAVLAEGARAQELPRLVPLGDTLTLQGLIEREPIALSGPLWVTLEGWPEGQEAPKLRLWLTEAVVGTVAGVEHRLTDLTLPAETVLDTLQSTRLDVTVKDVEWPAEYTGKLRYRIAGNRQQLDAARKAEAAKEDKDEDTLAVLARAAAGIDGEIALSLNVRTKPRIVAPEAELKLNLVRCSWPPSCFLAGLFVADETTPGPWPVELRNDSLGPVRISPQARLLREGTRSGGEVFVLGPAAEAEAVVGEDGKETGAVIARDADPAKFTLSVRRSLLSSGSYKGNLAFVAEPHGEPPLRSRGPDGAAVVRNRAEVSVAAEVSVRSGVCWVIFWIFVGIVAGRLNRQISTPEAQARLKLYDETVTLRDRINRLTDPALASLASLASFLGEQLAEIRSEVEDVERPDAEIRTALDRLRGQIDAAEDLGAAQVKHDRLQNEGKDADALALVQEEIAATGRMVRAGPIDEVKKSVERIRLALSEVEAGGNAAGVTVILQPAEAAARTARSPAPQAPAPPPAGTARPRLPRLVFFLAVLAGTRNLSIRARYWYLQPAATVLLLFTLTVYGVFLLYGGPENSTFGANGIADYVPLFLWGFGSDVLTKRLQDVAFTRS